MTDEQIMVQVRDRDIQKLAVLFDRYQIRLYNYFLKMTNDRMLSEDLVQNVFERVLKHKKTYRMNYPFGGWIFRIAKNCLADHYRKMKIKTSDIDISSPSWETADTSNQEPLYSELETALNALKPEFKEVLILTRFQDLKYKEVGNILGISENGIKARVHRALKQLRKEYLQIIAQ